MDHTALFRLDDGNSNVADGRTDLREYPVSDWVEMMLKRNKGK